MHIRGVISRIVRFPASPAIAALVAGLFLAPLYQYRLNPDALSYLGIAEEMATGTMPINTYWGPLLSWLLTPLLMAGVPGLLALKVLCALCAALATASGITLIRLLPMHERYRVMCGWTLALVSIGWAMGVTTPDLLLTAILGFALAVALHPKFPLSLWSGPAFGALGILAYLTKSVALPILILGIPLVWLLWRCCGVKRGISRTAVTAMITLMIGCAPWVALISTKAGHLTIGEAGPMIHASEGPGVGGLPISVLGLLEPKEGMLSVWEDPSKLPYESWSTFDSVRALKHQIVLLARNITDASAHLLSFSVFAFALLLGGVLLAWRHERGHARLAALLLVGACILNIAPYLPILVDARYLWISGIVLIALAGLLIDAMAVQMKPLARHVLAIVVFGSFLVLPLPNLLLGAHDGMSFAMQAKAMEPALRQKRIAADTWKTGLFFSYYVHGTYLGTPLPENIDAQLLEHDIDVYVSWKGPVDLTHYTEQSSSGNMRIYVRTGAS